MSLDRRPPKSPYGDKDFFKDDWASQQPQSSFANNLPPVYANQYPGLGPNSVPHTDNLEPPRTVNTPYNQPSQAGQVDVRNLVQSLTPEDQIFMQSWRRDSFFYRVLPLASIGNGIVFYYNHSKNLTHKPTRYLAVTSFAYLIGKWSFKGELKRRAESSQSHTPFMEALRAMIGASPPIGAGEFANANNQDYINDGFSSSNAPPSNDPYAQPYNQQKLDYRQNFQPHDLDSSLTTLPTSDSGHRSGSMTSYEELRARNRGLQK